MDDCHTTDQRVQHDNSRYYANLRSRGEARSGLSHSASAHPLIVQEYLLNRRPSQFYEPLPYRSQPFQSVLDRRTGCGQSTYVFKGHQAALVSMFQRCIFPLAMHYAPKMSSASSSSPRPQVQFLDLNYLCVSTLTEPNSHSTGNFSSPSTPNPHPYLRQAYITTHSAGTSKPHPHPFRSSIKRS